MHPDQVLRDIASILPILPGVAVELIALAPAKPSMTLSVCQLDSLAVVVYSSDGANLPLHLWTEAPRKPIAARADGSHLRYHLSSVGGNSTDSINQFAMFGCYLVWYLFDAGLMFEGNANELLGKWNGKLVGA